MTYWWRRKTLFRHPFVISLMDCTVAPNYINSACRFTLKRHPFLISLMNYSVAPKHIVSASILHFINEMQNGAGGSWTPDPLVANEMLSQLSYSPDATQLLYFQKVAKLLISLLFLAYALVSKKCPFSCLKCLPLSSCGLVINGYSGGSFQGIYALEAL